MRNLKFFFLFLFPVAAGAQDLVYARKILNDLCASEMHGRGYVSGGDSIAAAYIATEFKNSGLSPAGENFYQYFKIAVNTFPGEIIFKFGNRQLIPGKEFIVSPGSPSIDGIFKTCYLTEELFFSGKGYSSFLMKSSGKVVVIDKRIFENKPDADKKELERWLVKLKEAKFPGPAAVIVSGTDKLTWSTATDIDQRPVIYTNFLPMRPVNKTRIKIEAKFRSSNLTRNVTGLISPGQRVTDSLVVITAHYDHLGMMGKVTYFPGANDNASGIAMMLNLAKEFSSIRDSIRYPMAFIAFSGEEAGLLGSQYFIQHPLIDLDKIRFLINIDLAGTGDEGIMVVNATVYTREFQRMSRINEQYKLLPAVRSRGEACNSDHCFFHQRHVPCFFIYTLGGIKAYHDTNDRPETLPLTAYHNYFILLKQFILDLGPLPFN